MKAILFSLGTRGDIEPFLALAERLKKKGYDVVCAFPIQFQGLVDESEYEFFGLSEKFLELIEGEKAKIVLGGKGSFSQKINAYAWMIKESQSMQKEVIIQQHDLIESKQPDIIVYNQKCLFPIIWGMKNKGRTAMLSPLPCTVHEYEGHASLGMGSNLGSFLNKITYRFSNFFLFQTIKSSTKKYHKEYGLKVNSSSIKKHVLKKEKMVYTISSNLFPRPISWTENVHIVGYHERDQASNWVPDKQIESFISKHEKIVFITFGSMTNPNPEQKTKDILEVLVKHKIPAIINTAGGGLQKPVDYAEHVFFVENIPYDWIFPKIYAVVHHGGSGTTHSAIKYGCASMIVPHILDQHVWNDLLPELNLGPRGISIKKFNSSRFEEKLLDLLNSEKYKENARRIGKEMVKEDNEAYYLNTVMENVD